MNFTDMNLSSIWNVTNGNISANYTLPNYDVVTEAYGFETAVFKIGGWLTYGICSIGFLLGDITF